MGPFSSSDREITNSAAMAWHLPRWQGIHKKTYEPNLGEIAHQEAVRKQGAGYARKDSPDQDSSRLWRQCGDGFYWVDARSARPLLKLRRGKIDLGKPAIRV